MTTDALSCCPARAKARREEGDPSWQPRESFPENQQHLQQIFTRCCVWPLHCRDTLPPLSGADDRNRFSHRSEGWKS